MPNCLFRSGILLFFVIMLSPATPGMAEDEIRGIYIGSNAIDNPAKIAVAVSLLREKEINTIVVDKKDDLGIEFTGGAFEQKIRPFRALRAHIICRIVVFKFRDLNSLPYPNLEGALVRSKSADGAFWKNRLGDYYFDPSSEDVLRYIIAVSKRAIRDGCDELNYDYLRFPSDGALTDIRYPSGSETPELKRGVIAVFIQGLSRGIRLSHSTIPISADLFGYAAMGRNPGIGQFPEDFIRAGYKIYSMLYPSLFSCADFGLLNPNTNPYITVRRSVEEKLQYLLKRGLGDGVLRGTFTAWIQGNDSGSYQCKVEPNPRILYYSDPAVLRAQIRGIEDALQNGVFKKLNLKPSWIVWHSSGLYNPASYLPKGTKER